jgi:hypothetical protein
MSGFEDITGHSRPWEPPCRVQHCGPGTPLPPLTAQIFDGVPSYAATLFTVQDALPPLTIGAGDVGGGSGVVVSPDPPIGPPVTPVPLPAGPVLIVTAIAMLWLMRRIRP